MPLELDFLASDRREFVNEAHFSDAYRSKHNDYIDLVVDVKQIILLYASKANLSRFLLWRVYTGFRNTWKIIGSLWTNVVGCHCKPFDETFLDGRMTALYRIVVISDNSNSSNTVDN